MKTFCVNRFFVFSSVRTSFGLDSKTRMDLGPTSPNNKFVERGRKNYPKFRKDITIVEGLEEYLNK